MLWHNRLTARRCGAALALVSLCVAVSCGAPTTAPPSPSKTTVAIVATTTSPSAQTTAYAIPGCYYPPPDPRSQDRPTKVVLQGCMQNGMWLEGMSWTSWGPQSAYGTGTLAINTCTPACASGQGVTKSPAIVHAWNPQLPPDPTTPATTDCPANVMFYTGLILAFPDALPPSQDMPINARYQGMPASDVNTPSAPDNPNQWGFVMCS